MAVTEFVESGGWVLALDHAVDFAIDAFSLPIRNPVRDLPSQDFFIPGSLLHIEVDADRGVAAGMPPQAIAFFVRSQVLEVDTRAPMADDIDVYARYGAEPLASGWAHGADDHLAGKPAALRAPVGDGQVILIGFEPHFRGQPLGTFNLLFQPILEAAVRAGRPTS